MKFLVVSAEQDSLILQDVLIREGHEVRTWVKDKKYQENGKGIVPIVAHWEPYVAWANCIICDETGVDYIADTVRKQGKLCVGGTKTTRDMEEDRAAGMKILSDMGLNVPPWFGPFRSLDEVISFVKKNPDRYVIKPSGQLDRELTFVSKDDEDLISEVSHWKEKGIKIQHGCILQRFIPGKEIAIGCFVSQGKFLSPHFINWEHKRLLTGDLGPNTGEVATIGYWSAPNTKLGKELKKMEKWFAANAPTYTTYFDLNFMLSGETAYVLEPTVRFGYPTIGLQMETLGTEVGNFLIGLAKGKVEFTPTGPWGALVVISAPGFPYPESFSKHGADQVFEVDPSMYLYELTFDGEEYRTRKDGGIGGIVAIASAGKDLTEARTKVYEKIKGYDLPGKYGYRLDCGKKLQKDLGEYAPWIGLETP